MNWFQGDACSWAPQAGTSPGLYTLPTLKSPSWPRTVWTDFRSFYLSGLAKRRGSDSVWSLPALPQRSPPGGLCPLATLGAAPGTQECRQGRGGEPTGRSSGVSDGPGVPSHAGISQRVWAAGEQAFSVSAAHPVLKHVPSVSRGVGPVSNPSGPCDCRANHPHLPPPPTHLHLASPSLLSLIEGEGRTQVWVWASWVLISETVHPNLGRAWGKPLTPPALSHHSIPSEMNLAGVWPS